MLMGAVPYTTFLDISRGGVAKLMAKAYEYASGAMERNWKAYQKGTLDAKTKAFIDKFGVIDASLSPIGPLYLIMQIKMDMKYQSLAVPRSRKHIGRFASS
jgi:hypothetical protein